METESDIDETYCYGVRLESRKKDSEFVRAIKGSFTVVKVYDKSLKLLIYSGSSVNILDEADYEMVGSPTLLKYKTKNEASALCRKRTLKVHGICKIRSRDKGEL